MKAEKTARARNIFAQNLRLLRQQKGMSQEQLAEAASLHRTYVSSVERAARNISIDNMERLARALAVDIRDLLSPEPRHEATSRQEEA